MHVHALKDEINEASEPPDDPMCSKKSQRQNLFRHVVSNLVLEAKAVPGSC